MTTRVFLSYARGDDGEPFEPSKSFVARLHADLTEAGFDVWFDRVSMPSRQLTFHQEIADAIRSRDRLVLVVGPKASLSDYVRQEWHWALELDRPVIPILRKGDFTVLPGELSLLHCDDFRDDARYAAQLAKLIDNLNRPEPPLGGLFGVPNLPPHFRGRPELMRRVKEALLVDLQKPVVVTSETSRVGVQGMGGIGKSVLAAALARDREIRRCYPDGILWVSVGQKPNLAQLQRDVTRHLGSQEQFETDAQGKGVLRQLLLDKAVLLVLDDVWNACDAAAFDVLGPRCRALVTTRDAGVVHTLHGELVPVSLFTEDEALQLLADAVGAERAGLPPEAREVVRQCGCLPLAVALCGGMARKRGGEWAGILDRLRRADLEKIADRQAINPQHESIWRAMLASVEVLPLDEQRRFAELSVFEPGQTVPESAVGTLWSHCGNLSDLDTDDLLISLAERSLIRLDTAAGQGTPPRHRVGLHDLLRDFASRMAGESKSLHETLLAAYGKRCADGWPSGPNDGYFYQNLRYHLVNAERPGELAELLRDLRWLEAKNAHGLVFDLLGDFAAAMELLPPDNPRRRHLKLLAEALRRDIHFIARHAADYPQALFQCLWNNAWWYDCDQAAAHYVQPEGGWNETNAPWLRPVAEKLSPLLEQWRRQRKQSSPSFLWLRSHRPPPVQLGTALQAVLRGHGDLVSSVAYSPDGRRIVSGSFDNTVRVWDADSGAELAVLRGHEHWVLSVAYSPDGRRIVSGSDDKTVRVWDADSGAVLAVLRGHQEVVTSVAYSPDGRRIVSGSGDKTVRVWDADSGVELAVLRGHEDLVPSVAYSPDGRRIVSGSCDNTVRVWDAESGAELAVFRGHESIVASVAYSAGGRRIVSGSFDKTVRVWDADSGAELAVLRGHESIVASVAYSPDGRRIVSGGSWDNTVRVWDAESGAELPVLCGHEKWVFSVAYSPDGRRIVSGSGDNTVRVWDAESGAELAILRGHEEQVNSVAYSPDGRRIVSGSDDSAVRVLDADRGAELVVLRGHAWGVNSVAYSPDGRRIVSGSGDNTVRVWDAESGAELAVLRGHERGVWSVAYSPDGRRIVSGSRDKTVRVWDAHIFECIEVVQGSEDVASIAAGQSISPFRVLARGMETMVERAAASKPVAWFPIVLYRITTCPSRRSWAGAVGPQLHIVTLEGLPGPSGGG